MSHQTAESAYLNLKTAFARMRNISYISEILGKDAETTMAKGSLEDRISQQLTLSDINHGIVNDPRMGEWLDTAESNADSLPPEDRRNLALMRREWLHETSLPADLARELARLGAEGEPLHTEHYKSGKWDAVKDWYAHSFAIMREVGEAKKERMGFASAYEALIDQFTPGLTADHVEREFAALDNALQALIPAAFEYQNSRPDPVAINGPFPVDAQMVLNHKLAKAVGFDTSRGVLYAINGHPSMGGSPDDSRMTTRCNEEEFFDSIYSTVHETGHALYQQNLPKDWRYQPAGDHMGMAVHESQSMIIEYQACMHESFLHYLSGELRAAFNRQNDPAFT